MIKIGEIWKFVELPRAVDPEKPLVAVEGGIRSWLFDGESSPPARGPETGGRAQGPGRVRRRQRQAPGRRRQAARSPSSTSAGFPCSHKVVKVAPDAEEQLNYNKQIVDSLAAAYPDRLLPGRPEGARQAGRTREASSAPTPPSARSRPSSPCATTSRAATSMANQKNWMTDLKTFLDEHRSPRGPRRPHATGQRL